MKRIIRKIKKILGLELPYLLDEECDRDNILVSKYKHFYEERNWEDTNKKMQELSKVMNTYGMTVNEAREKIGFMKLK